MRDRQWNRIVEGKRLRGGRSTIDKTIQPNYKAIRNQLIKTGVCGKVFRLTCTRSFRKCRTGRRYSGSWASSSRCTKVTLLRNPDHEPDEEHRRRKVTGMLTTGLRYKLDLANTHARNRAYIKNKNLLSIYQQRTF